MAAATRGPVSQTITKLPAEPLVQQLLGASADRGAVSLDASEEGRRPGPLPDRVEVPAHVGEHLRDLLLGQLVHQALQLVTLRTTHARQSTMRPS
jgi:hypothetical protein